MKKFKNNRKGTVLYRVEKEMIYDTYDYEILRLCGLCKYIPADLQERYGGSLFEGNTISNLQEQKLIKMQSDKLSYKLTEKGRTLLAKMGLQFPQDARMNINRSSYDRRLYSAKFTILLYLAGIDVFCRNKYDLNNKKVAYITKTMLYNEDNQRALAGTRFLGILKIHDTAYISYYVENDADGIVVRHEMEMYMSFVRELTDIYHVKILLVGDTLEELVRNVYSCNKPAAYTRGKKNFKTFLEECGCNSSWVSANANGVMQMRILKSWRCKDKLLRLLDLEGTQPENFKICDGIVDGYPFVLVLDMDIRSKKGALQQIAYTNYHNTIPCVYCLDFQVPSVEFILRRDRFPACKIRGMNTKMVIKNWNDDINYLNRQPYTKNGEFMELREIIPYRL